MPHAEDPMFEAICEAFGWSTKDVPKTSRSAIGKVGAEIAAAGGTPEMVRFASRAWSRMWGDDVPTFTPTAMLKWWPEIARRFRSAQKVAVRRREEAQEPPPVFLPREEQVRNLRALRAFQRGEISMEELTDVIGGGGAPEEQDETRLESRVAALVET
jgi:hypothetical protein